MIVSSSDVRPNLSITKDFHGGNPLANVVSPLGLIHHLLFFFFLAETRTTYQNWFPDKSSPEDIECIQQPEQPDWLKHIIYRAQTKPGSAGMYRYEEDRCLHFDPQIFGLALQARDLMVREK